MSATLMCRTAVAALLLGALLWPALYNHQPFFFPDTTAYLRGADAGIERATHHATPWSLSNSDESAGLSRSGDPPVTPGVSSVRDKTVLAGRSVYYGALLYLGEITGGFWLSVALQALAILLVIGLTLRAAAIPLRPWLPAITLVLAICTSLPLYASFLMPDLFAGVMILGTAVLLAVRTPMPKAEQLIWFALLTAAMMFHDSHALIAFVMLVLGLLWNTRGGWENWRGLRIIVAAVAIAAVAQFAFAVAVARLVGAPPLHPPFLMARVIADGPGYQYLKATCPGNGFKICQFLDRLPLDASSFLWVSGNPHGVFSDTSPQMRRELAAEQTRFVLAVLRYDPLGEATAAIANIVEQLSMTGLTEFEYTDLSKQFFVSRVPSEHMDLMRRTAAYRHTMPTRSCAIIDTLFLLIALLFLAGVSLLGRARNRISPIVGAIAIWLVAGVLVNSVVCGVLSGPNARYSVRVAWLAPLAALIVAADLFTRARRDARRSAAGIVAPGRA